MAACGGIVRPGLAAAKQGVTQGSRKRTLKREPAAKARRCKRLAETATSLGSSVVHIYGNTGEVATYANLKKEISTQAETVYGLSVSNETASVLASIAQEVVGNDSFDSATSAPSIESADKVYVFQVSSNGAAKLLVSELDFKEPEPAGGALETPDSEK